MSAGDTPDRPPGPGVPEQRGDPEGPGTPEALVKLWDWLRGRLVYVGYGLGLFGPALVGLVLLAGSVTLLSLSLVLAVKAGNPETIVT